jgi:hypothetical protein
MKIMLLLYGFSLLFGLIWSYPRPVIPPAPGPKADLNDYVGTYKMKEYFQAATVTVQDGALYGEVDGNGNYKLLPQDEPDTFKSTSSYGTLYVFTRDGQTKKVAGLTLKLMGQEVSGDKAQP